MAKNKNSNIDRFNFAKKPNQIKFLQPSSPRLIDRKVLDLKQKLFEDEKHQRKMKKNEKHWNWNKSKINIEIKSCSRFFCFVSIVIQSELRRERDWTRKKTEQATASGFREEISAVKKEKLLTARKLFYCWSLHENEMLKFETDDWASYSSVAEEELKWIFRKWWLWLLWVH